VTAILDAALSEYAARRLDRMSVGAVAVRAGVSKAAIYRRYPSKVKLVAAAAMMACDESLLTPIPARSEACPRSCANAAPFKHSTTRSSVPLSRCSCFGAAQNAELAYAF
jgi:AcrR family transcriptional regulator